jgi:hypothetical protein
MFLIRTIIFNVFYMYVTNTKHILDSYKTSGTIIYIDYWLFEKI